VSPEDTAFAVFLSIMLVALVWAIVGAMRHCLRDGRGVVYVVGSLRNARVPQVAGASHARLRRVRRLAMRRDRTPTIPCVTTSSPGDERSSKRWLVTRRATSSRSISYHLQRADTVVLVMPAGKSGFLELGWALGQGKRGYILFDGDPDRIDIMMQFADGICYSIEELKEALQNG
jgi:hypothetical protein